MFCSRYIQSMPIKWRLREVLSERGMTALELSRALGVKHPTIYRMVKRRTVTRISGPMLDRLCKALDCQPGDLMIR
jgi:putative transcriptional regulator